MTHDDLGLQLSEVSTATSTATAATRAMNVEIPREGERVKVKTLPGTVTGEVAGTALRDPVALARALLGDSGGRPRETHTLRVLAGALVSLGFTVRELSVGEGVNRRRTLFARIGEGSPRVGFAAHVGATEKADMKGAVAGFIAAVARMQETRQIRPQGSLSLLLTTEAADATTPGIAAVTDWLTTQGELPEVCIVGAPTSRARLGDVIKIGCRGTLHGVVTVQGRAGHTACPELADNPVSRLLRFLSRLDEAQLDHGSSHFPPSSLTVTTVDVGNPASHVIPDTASAAFEIRYNDLHTRLSLESWLRRLAVAQLGSAHQLELRGTGDTTVKPPGALSEAMCAAISAITGQRPAIDTGSEDAGVRLIRRHCPVVEFGPRGETMHEADEQDALTELEQLTQVYQGVMSRLLADDSRARSRGNNSRHDATQGTPGRITPSAVFSSISMCLQAATAYAQDGAAVVA
ncbi:MAG TPA: M20/M25/M40 family metallo-hydrolase [Nannocystis sp.]